MAVCWPCWHYTYTGAGDWFRFGWDPMLDDVGFLSLLLAMTLTLYDDLIEEPAYDAHLEKTRVTQTGARTTDDEAPLEKAAATESYGSFQQPVSETDASGIEQWAACN